MDLPAETTMNVDDLTPPARARHYRDCARRQLRLAATAETAELRATCLELAAMWTRLAEAVAHAPDAIPEVGEGGPEARA